MSLITLLFPKESRVFYYGNNFISNLIIDSIFKSNDLKKGVDNLIDLYVENGYPFVKIDIDSVLMVGDFDLYYLTIKENGQFYIERVENIYNVKSSYLNGILRIRNKLFKESLIVEKLKNLSFNEDLIIDTTFFVEKVSDTSVLIKTKIQQGKLSSISGILTSSLDTLSLNGFLNIYLKSPFGFFDVYSINYQRINKNNSYLTGFTEFPYIFSTPIGLFGNISFESIETYYNKEEYSFGLKVFVTEKFTVSTGYGKRNINFLSSDSSDISENYLIGSVDFFSKRFFFLNRTTINYSEIKKNWAFMTQKFGYKNSFKKIGYWFSFDSYMNFSSDLKDYMKIQIGGNDNLKGYPENFLKVYNFFYQEIKSGYLGKNIETGLFFDNVLYNIEKITDYKSYSDLFSYGIFLTTNLSNYRASLYYALNKDITPLQGRIHLLFSIFF
ncbi:MAG: Surface antigen (D15) [candidate division TA06 bacterium 32_111]|uniref:Surface antigen (D15) n=2 Tax=Bacteria candidate phyla TaxID=1783234 RepID=A0A101I1S8_UNCT6|nr:MAG: Surface antigen (D15) [candidate division TA06 bacterium 32_111]KUK86819.1 MAG: Surface antigen (D15) [candidate division TA06 bacterium 34_109]HAF07335.1 hypothetical protein [candidate division WOR-3 bacterium]HCP16829.1 hypothetical protein [candidate division WOR-3 bacterium]